MTASPSQAIAIFGGAFDPPHRTHLRIVEAARIQLPIAEVVVLPAGDHPHKRSARMSPAIDRFAMCRLAFGTLPRVRVDDREVLRKGPSFTVDTLAEFRAEAPDRPLYFLIGSDNLPLLPTWKDHHRILSLCTVATFPRQGHPIGPAILKGLDLTPREREVLLSHVLAIEPDDVSATDLRARLARGERHLPELVPAVEDFAVRAHLYRK